MTRALVLAGVSWLAVAPAWAQQTPPAAGSTGSTGSTGVTGVSHRHHRPRQAAAAPATSQNETAAMQQLLVAVLPWVQATDPGLAAAILASPDYPQNTVASRATTSQVVTPPIAPQSTNGGNPPVSASSAVTAPAQAQATNTTGLANVGAAPEAAAPALPPSSPIGSVSETTGAYGNSGTTGTAVTALPQSTLTAPSTAPPPANAPPPSTYITGNCGGTSTGGKGLTVGPHGFTAPNGQAWEARGVDAATVQEAIAAFPNVVQQLPGMTMLRLAVQPGRDTQAQIDQAVVDYTSKGIVVEVEDHSGNPANITWYQQQAANDKDNPLVIIGTPNEPSGNVAANQIAVVQAVRAAGFNNPIGLEFDYNNGQETSDNLGTVVAATGKSNLFAEPHIYGDAWQANAANEAAAAGLYTVVNEFGDATNGVDEDPNGVQVVNSVIQSAKTGAIGATYWAIGNGYHQTDNVCEDPACTKLSAMGALLQSTWLGSSGGQITQSSIACTAVAATPAQPAGPSAIAVVGQTSLSGGTQ